MAAASRRVGFVLTLWVALLHVGVASASSIDSTPITAISKACYSASHVLRGPGAVGYLAIIAVQYGVQPLLVKTCISPGVPTTSLVLGAEIIKIFGCIAACTLRENSGIKEALRGWTLQGSLVAAGLPSITYVFQNYCVQIAYQNLDGMVFNVLNQSKILFTAIFAFLIAGRRQSALQCVALGLVTFAGILVSAPQSGSASHNAEQESRALGISCALAAAAPSGVGSGITEWALRNGNRNNYLLSLELAAMGLIVILGGLLTGVTADGAVWRTEGLFTRWRFATIVPVMAQGLSGILVGIVTKISGGVRKVLATICGLILTCFIQQLVYGGYPSFSVILAVPLVASGVYLHATNPPKVSSAEL